MGETCRVGVHHGPFGIRDCERPAKGSGRYFGSDVPMCGLHLAAIRRSKENDEKRRAQWAANDKARDHARALAAAREEVTAAARAESARHGSKGWHHGHKCACRLCVAIAAYDKLEVEKC